MKRKKLRIPYDKFYASSDWHLDHKNIIKYDGRPFESLEEMNKTIVKNHSHLGPDDHLFILGDISFNPNPKEVLQMLKPLKCHLYWIIGNHDDTLLEDDDFCKRFEFINDVCQVYIIEPDGEKRLVYMLHYRCDVWNKSHHASWHLFGHSHHSLKDNPHTRSMDVGVNGHDYMPVTYEQIKAHMDTKIYIPVDHHNEATR